MNSKIYSATLLGLDTYLVEIEADIIEGKKQINIIGLTDYTIQESKKRIQSAIRNSGIVLPDQSITLNLAPASLKKTGTGFDLSLAISLLQVTKRITVDEKFLNETLFLGELGLDGSLKASHGIFSIALDAEKLKKKRLVVPSSAFINASLNNIEILCADTLSEIISYLNGAKKLKTLKTNHKIIQSKEFNIDFSEINGQIQAKRAMQIAAAGWHHSIFMGPPGSGKTMLAQRLQTIMNPLTANDMIEITRIYSSTGSLTQNDLITNRPFRSPHHTISYGGLVGGGSQIKAGEITLSHKGILFLDEITEFSKKTLEVLRQPLEEKVVTIARASSNITFPADFLLVAAFNPCPCGFAGSIGNAQKRCSCPKLMIDNYLKKLSGPFLDRIDIQLTLQAVEYSETLQKSNNKTSKEMYQEIEYAIEIQKKRGIKNGNMGVKEIEQYCILTEDAQKIIKLSFEKLNLSMRSYHKILKVARTIADIDNKDIIDTSHIKEAFSYRQIDQKIMALL
jgi:magnesium chelatase family protein